MPQGVLLLPPGTEVPGTPIHPVEGNGTEDRVAAPVRVLLVEDEILTALDIEYLVQQLGYEVCGIAASAPEAVQATSLLTQSIGEGFYKQLCAEEG